MTAYRADITPEEIGMAVLARLAAMSSMRHAGPITSLNYCEVDPRGADGLVRDFVALSSGHGEHHAPGCGERLHELGAVVLANSMARWSA